MGGSCFLFRRPCAQWDTRLLSRHQRAQAGTRTLGDLAVLLRGPPVQAAELAPRHRFQLAGQDQPLIGRQLLHMAADPAQFVPEHHELLQVRPHIDDLDTLIAARPQRQGGLQRGLHRASPRDRAPTVTNPGLKPLLEQVAEMHPVGESATLANERNKLERGLAVAVLEVLRPQLISIDTQQHVALRSHNQSHLLRRIAAAPAPGAALLSISGRHMGMSSERGGAPPSQMRRSPNRGLPVGLGGASG